MKKNILLFGANGYIAKCFIDNYKSDYLIHPIYKKERENLLALDFTRVSSIHHFVKNINFEINGILFLQGMNPSMGMKDITEEHFDNMLKINISSPAIIVRELAGKFAEGCSVLFFSSVAKRKGSYDPAYAAAKAGLVGLMHSLANAYPVHRFNIISLGLVEESTVFNQMTDTFREKHASHMQNNKLVKSENISQVIDLLLKNENINRADFAVDGGYV
jgi:3-oxoacyl-[acyl-carrier protein] reductase